jgi:hypothetical protein
MPAQPLGPTGLLAQSLTLPAGSQSMAMGGMRMQAQGMDGRKKGTSIRDWIAQVGDATINASSDIAVDAQGGLYLVGRTATSPETFLARYAPDGPPLWCNRINGMSAGGSGTPPANPTGGGVAVDPSGNVIVVGYSIGPFVLETRKYSPAGQLLWGRTYSAGDGILSRGVVVGSSGAVYVLGSVENSPSGYAGNSQLVLKYSATGAFQWSRNINAVSGFGLSIDASENVYVGGQSLIKLNSAGTIQWAVQRTSGSAELLALAASPTGETCAVGYVAGPTGALLSFDTSGALLWQRGLTNARWMSVMRSGQSIYCAGWLDGGPNDLLLAEYDTAGTLKWQQRIDSTGDNFAIALADIDASSMAVAGTTNFSGTDCLISRYPKSGARPGPLGPYTIINSTATTATPAEAYSSYSPASTSVGSDAASALTDTAISLPATIYPL